MLILLILSLALNLKEKEAHSPFLTLVLSLLNPVAGKKQKKTLETEIKFKLPLSLSKKDKFLSSTMLNSTVPQFNNSGIYIFVNSSGKLAIGSAMSFKRRLIDHMSSFKGHRIMQKLHKFTKENGGVTELSWAPLVITPNYYDLFISLYPNYELKKEEIQILVFMSQFMPRVLEQSFLSHYKPELNGSKNGSYIVNFSLSEWVPSL